MAYYNNYVPNNQVWATNPYSYPQSTAPTMVQQQMPQSYDAQNDTTVAWVQGRSGAEAYPMGPGRRAMLMDSNEPVLYVKQTDMSGRYMPLQSYRLVPMEEQSQAQALPAESIDYDKIREIISEEVNKKMNYNNRKETK